MIRNSGAALTGVSLLTIAGFGCGWVATEPSETLPGGAVSDSERVKVVVHRSGTGELLYVTNVTSSTISVVDVASPGSVRETIALPSVGWLTGTSDGTLLVATMPSDDAVALIDTRDNSVLQTIPVGDAPQMVVLAPDDRTAYVANLGSETITVIDLTTASVAAEIALAEDAQGAFGVALSSDGEYLYVTRWAAENALGPGTLEKVDLTRRETVAKIAVGVQPFDVEISPDGRMAVVSSFQGVVTDVDLVTERLVVDEVGATLVPGLAFSPGG